MFIPNFSYRKIIKQIAYKIIKKNLKKYFTFNFENIENFENLIVLVSKKKEIEIKYDLEKNVNLVSFNQGKINISFNENLSKNFIKNLSEKLLQWTGKRWIITLTREIGQKTVFEKKIESEKIFLEKERKDQFFKDFKEFFPDANLVSVNLKDE